MQVIVALALVAIAAAAPQTKPEPPKILRSEFEQQPEGAYQFRWILFITYDALLYYILFSYKEFELFLM